MSRRARIALIIGGSLVGLVLVVVVAALMIARTEWFRNMVRERIVHETEDATGGRVEIASFSFDWRRLYAEVKDFTIHGTEPPGSQPLFRARSVQVGLKIVSAFKRKVDIAYLGVVEPQVYVLVRPDGTTNLPEPKVKTKTDKSPLETVVDLAIRRFVIDNGSIDFDSRKTPLDAKGENLRAKFFYDLVGQRYTGDVSIKPLYIQQQANQRPLPIEITMPVTLGKQRIEISSAHITTPASQAELTVILDDAMAPRGSVRLHAGLALRELAPYIGEPSFAKAKQTLNTELSLNIDGDRANIAGARLGLGQSQAEASGVIDSLKDQRASLRFNAKLALGELGRLLQVANRPEGIVQIGGDARLAGTSEYSVVANLDAKNVAFTQGQTRLTGIQAGSKVNVNPRLIELNNLQVAALGGTFTGSAAVEKMARFRLDGTAKNFALRELARSYGSQPVVWDGIVSGPVHVEGDINGRDLRANTRLGITPGTRGVPLSGAVAVNYDRRRDVLDLDSSYIATPATRLDFSGSLGTQVRLRLVSRDLNDFLPAMALASPTAPKSLPVALDNGTASFDGTITGKLDNPSIAGHIAVTNFIYEQQRVDRLAADVDAKKSGVTVRNAVLAQGKMQAQANASLALQEWKPDPNGPVSATASLQEADLTKLFALAGQKTAPVTGTLRASAKVTGTFDDPRATLDATVLKGVAYEEPFDRFQASIRYDSRQIELTSAQLAARSARVDLKGAFEHPPKDFRVGTVHFHLASNSIPLQQLQTLQKSRPGVTGAVQLAADGSAKLEPPGRDSRVLLSKLNANLTARNVALDQKRVGDLTATAETKGNDVAFQLRSDFGKSDIRGNGTWRLAGDYPLDAHVTFSQVRLSNLQEWLAKPESANRSNLDGVAEGKIDVTGPVRKIDDLKGNLELTKLELASTAKAAPKGAAASPPFALRNPEPIVVTLDRSMIRIRSAHLVGTATDIAATGTVGLQEPAKADLRVKGGIGLQLLEIFNPDVLAGGNIAVDAAIKGQLKQPEIDGRIQLKEASLNMEDVPNGISKANGLIVFNKKQAVIENLTAETGGGKLTFSGFVAFGEKELEFRLDANAKQVRVRYPEGASTVANASLNLTGNTTRSLLSGTVTILQTSFQPRTDFASMLAKTAQPTHTETPQTGPLAGMQFDIRIQTSPDIKFRTAMAQDLQADANLRLRGTPSRPAMLGRINITQGDIIFLGNKYTLNQGTIAFYDPQKIEPILNIDLETKARGVDIILTISGPIDKMQVTHRSDPPLQFSEIVGLLATGKTPTSDPGLVARQAAEPQQTWQQMGASYLGQAVANPVSGRLQRLFGVSKLKFDPQITGTENTPEARITLEQQVSRDITFTYIQNVSQTNAQTVRVEWAVNKQWSAILLREETGRVGLDFQYKIRIK